ncbi:MAG: RNA polymerase sigma factor [Clostridia bacterium]|nr:RNA polymerase sigma factor [Clostridia bacterium]
MSHLESLLQSAFLPLQRFVHYKVSNYSDAEDLVQEICLTATQRFETLKDPTAFKAWLFRIAVNHCNDYFRKKAKALTLSYEELPEAALAEGGTDRVTQSAVYDTVCALGEREQQILFLYFYEELSQEAIAKRLSIPLGTVKSRLHYAKEKFKRLYPYPPKAKGDFMMKALPELMPTYQITPSSCHPFSVKWEELQGWLLVPRLGERLKWGLYDAQSRRRTEYTELEVVGRAQIHGIDGVEIVAVQYGAEDYYRTGAVDRMERRFVAQLTDTHCRYLAESHVEDGVRRVYTFLDGDAFLQNWGFGEENCGNPIHLFPKGLLHRKGNVVESKTETETLDIVGRYTVTLGGREYDTVCVMDVQCFNDGVASEQYLDPNGRTVLWRRFNRDDWALHRYGALWSERFPENERLIINGQTYVHWYDCLPDTVL